MISLLLDSVINVLAVVVEVVGVDVVITTGASDNDAEGKSTLCRWSLLSRLTMIDAIDVGIVVICLGGVVVTFSIPIGISLLLKLLPSTW